MEKKIAVINGDGIGPEVTAQSIKVLNAIAEEFGHQFSYTHAFIYTGQYKIHDRQYVHYALNWTIVD